MRTQTDSVGMLSLITLRDEHIDQSGREILIYQESP